MVGQPVKVTARTHTDLHPWTSYSLEEIQKKDRIALISVVVALTLVTIFMIYQESSLRFEEGRFGSFQEAWKATWVDFGELFIPKHNIALKCSIVGVLAVGGAIALYYVTHSERQIASRIGEDGKPVRHILQPATYRGNGHYRRAELRWREHDQEHSYDKLRHDAIVDTSTLENGSGFAPVYENQPPEASIAISFYGAIAALPTAAGAMIYNVLRIIPITLYIFGSLIYEKCSGTSRFKDDPFEWKDLIREPLYSLKAILQAPFYGVALLYAQLYSLVSPINGRKMTSQVELAWNYNENEGASTPINRGWFLMIPSSHWSLEGGGAPSHLGANNGFTLAMCRHHIGWVKFEKGKVVDATNEAGTRPYAIAIEDRKEDIKGLPHYNGFAVFNNEERVQDHLPRSDKATRKAHYWIKDELIEKEEEGLFGIKYKSMAYRPVYRPLPANAPLFALQPSPPLASVKRESEQLGPLSTY